MAENCDHPLARLERMPESDRLHCLACSAILEYDEAGKKWVQCGGWWRNPPPPREVVASSDDVNWTIVGKESFRMLQVGAYVGRALTILDGIKDKTPIGEARAMVEQARAHLRDLVDGKLS